MPEELSLRAWQVRLPAAASKTARHLEIAAGAALAGGQAALAHYASDELVVRDKNAAGTPVAGPKAENPVTLADHASNDAILEFLRSRSAYPVLSEESSRPSDISPGARLWVVDPLDGTKEFIARNGEFSVMVGLAVHEGSVLGAVYQPAVDRLYLGLAAGGAWVVDAPLCNGVAAPLHLTGVTAQPLRFIRSRSHPDPALTELESRIGPVEVVISGSVGIKCARIARGEADLYVHPVPYLKEWDTCAPEAVLRGAGGRVTDCAGEPLRYGNPDAVQKHGIFCGSPDVHERVGPIVRQVARGLFSG
jgi:3'(2'), 5'-bisphosphate nucleotidase